MKDIFIDDLVSGRWLSRVLKFVTVVDGVLGVVYDVPYRLSTY